MRILEYAIEVEKVTNPHDNYILWRALLWEHKDGKRIRLDNVTESDDLRTALDYLTIDDKYHHAYVGIWDMEKKQIDFPEYISASEAAETFYGSRL